MTLLSPSMRLRRAANLRIRTESGPDVVITTDAGLEARFGRHALAILDQFAYPAELAHGLHALRGRTRGAQEWIELTSTVVQLYQAGALRDEAGSTPEIGVKETGFGSAPIHIAMLNHRARTAGFLAAVRETVRPGDVVVDIGTGTGVLAVAAARAGARHVYAVEMGQMAALARDVFEANGVADRVSLIQGRSTEIELPERADVLVSEIIGNEPLGEQVLEVFRDARQRLLAPDARFVPHRLTICGVPVAAPEGELAKRFFDPDDIRKWREFYDIDFGPLAAAQPAPNRWIFVRPETARSWSPVADPIVLANIDLASIGSVTVDNVVEGTATRDGRIDGVLLFFELGLGPTVSFATRPGHGGSASSWRVPVALLPAPLPVLAGDSLTVTYRYGIDAPHATLDLHSRRAAEAP